MNKTNTKTRLQNRKNRTYARVKSVATKPIVYVFRSNKFIYASIVDLKTGKTIAGVKAKSAEEAGTKIAEKAVAAKVKSLVFNRGPYAYHGRVKLLAEAMRKSGITI